MSRGQLLDAREFYADIRRERDQERGQEGEYWGPSRPVYLDSGDARPAPDSTRNAVQNYEERIESIKQKFSKMQRSKSAPIAAIGMRRSSSAPTLAKEQISAGSTGSGIVGIRRPRGSAGEGALPKQERQGKGEEAKITPREERGPPAPREEGRKEEG